MRIVVVGAGGVGGYFGGRLAAAGQDVWFIARGAHLAALRQGGLRLLSGRGDLHLPRVQATDRAEEVPGPADIIFLTVKLWDTEDAARAIAPLVGPATGVVSFQNGVDAAQRLQAILGPAPVLGGVCHIAAVIAEPGVIRQTGAMERLTVGELDGSISPRVSALAEAGAAAGLDIRASADIRRDIWEKFVFLASFSGVTSLTRLPKGPIWAAPETRALLQEALAEATAVARTAGAALPEDHADRAMAFAESLAPAMKSSMLGDLERGARLELPWLSGTVAAMGAASGVPTPVHRVIAQALRPYVDGKPALG